MAIYFSEHLGLLGFLILLVAIIAVSMSSASSYYDYYGSMDQSSLAIDFQMMGGFASFFVIILMGLMTIYNLLVAIPQIVLFARRLHDLDKSAWWLMGSILVAVPLLNLLYIIVMIVFFCLPGTKGENRFGKDPYQSNDQ